MGKPMDRPGKARNATHIQAIEVTRRQIARCAAAMCGDGDTIVLGSGSITFDMTEFLLAKRLRILTNSFLAARRLLHYSENEVFLPGGTISVEQNLIPASPDTQISSGYVAGRLFIGAGGLSQLGLMEDDLALAEMNRRWMRQAYEIIVLADSSQFTSANGYFLCGLEQISCVITDSGISPEHIAMLERAGIVAKIVDADRCLNGPVMLANNRNASFDAGPTSAKETRH